MILSMIFKADSSAYTPPVIPEIGDSKELFLLFARELPAYMKEIAVSLLPIILFFHDFPDFHVKINNKKIKEDRDRSRLYICGAGAFPYRGERGLHAGGKLSRTGACEVRPPAVSCSPSQMIMGCFIVKAEPAVYVLNKQVEEITDGADLLEGHGNRDFPWVLRFSLGLAMVRVPYRDPRSLWFLIPGYAIALGISFLCRRSIQRSPSTPAAWHRDR